MVPPPDAQVFWLPEDDTSAIALVEPPAVLSANADPQPIAGAAIAVNGDGDASLFQLCEYAVAASAVNEQ